MSNTKTAINSAINRKDAWIITCEDWAEHNNYIILQINGESINFELPITRTVQECRATKVVYVWRNNNYKSTLKNPTINFSLTIPDITPKFDTSKISSISSEVKFPTLSIQKKPNTGVYSQKPESSFNSKSPKLYTDNAPIGIQNIYALSALVDERRIRTTKDGNRVDNRIVISISTNAFPRLLLYGQFSPEGLTIDQGIDNMMTTVNFSIIVTDTYPKLGYRQWSNLIQNYRNHADTDQTTMDYTTDSL